MRSVCARLLVSLLILCVISPMHAADLTAADGEVLLKTSGNIKNTNVDGEAWFDLAMLKSIGVTEIKTESPWTDYIVLFLSAPLLITMVLTAALVFKALKAAQKSYGNLKLLRPR